MTVLSNITLRLLDGWHSRAEAIEKLQKLIEKKIQGNNVN